MGLHSSVGRACSANAEMGFTPVKTLCFFFWAKIQNCLNCVYNFDDDMSKFTCIPTVQINFILSFNPVTGKDELDTQIHALIW